MVQKKHKTLSLLCVGMVFLSSCETIHTKHHEVDESASGVTYAMPVRYAKLSFTRNIQVVTSKAKISADYKNKKSEFEALEKLYKAAEKLHAETMILHEYAKTNNVDKPIIDSLVMALKETDTAKEKAKEKMDAAKAKLEISAKMFLEVWEGKDPSESSEFKEPIDKLVVELLPVSADPNLKFSTTFPHSALRNEHHFLKINEHGLLQSADIETADQTSSILTAIASTIGVGSVDGGLDGFASPSSTERTDVLFNGRPGGAPLVSLNGLLNNVRPDSGSFTNLEMSYLLSRVQRLTSLANQISEAIVAISEEDVSDIDTSACDGFEKDQKFWSEKEQLAISNDSEELSHETVLDPVDYGSVDSFNKILCSMGSNLRFAVTRPSSPNTQLSVIPSNLKPACVSNAAGLCEGIVYRRLQPVQFSVEQIVKPATGSVIKIKKEAKMEMIPNASPLDYVEDSSSLFSARTSNMKFVNGVLTEYHVVRPSEINEMAQATYDVMLAPFKAVSEVVSFQVKSGEGKKALAQAAYDIEKLRLDNLKSQSATERDLLTTSIETEQFEALREAELELAILRGDTALQNELTTQRANEAAIATEAFNAQVEAINRASNLSEAELDATIRTLKKRKEILELQRELEELSTPGE